MPSTNNLQQPPPSPTAEPQEAARPLALLTMLLASNHCARRLICLTHRHSRSSAATTVRRSLATMPSPRPSSSIVVLSPTNQVLLLHRVNTSTSFASAHVFPGGNLDAFHDGEVPRDGDPGLHRDGSAYRMGAVRETFEETGILLARGKGDEGGKKLLEVERDEAAEARGRVHRSEVRFGDWLDSQGGVPDTDNLIPFTRWITPSNLPKRFTTQMYLYLLPISSSPTPSSYLLPTPDGGLEHTAALFASPQHFLSQASAGEIILFPPQHYLLTLLARFLPSSSSPSAQSSSGGPLHYQAQRDRLLEFLRSTPTADTDKGRAHGTAQIPWADKTISPRTLFVRGEDGRVVLGLERPGPELEAEGKRGERGGDWERVVLVRFTKKGPVEVEVRGREEVFEEERRWQEGRQQKL